MAVVGLAATPTLAAAAEDDSSGLGVIVVTAQKRAQSVQDVPIAVTAIGGETLQANRILNVTDLTGLAPGVTVRITAGGSKIPSFTIRGAVSYGVVPGSDKQVSMYLDGVYLSSPRGATFELPDVERIEMLRGPQGTLFGRNATAGAVSITTRDPTGEIGVRASGTLGNHRQRRYQVSVDLPQIGPFSGYMSYVHDQRNGDIRNLNAGQLWDRTAALTKGASKIRRSPDTLGSKDADSWFAAIKFESGDFTTVYKYDRSEDRGSPEGNAFIGYNMNLGPLSNFLTALINSQAENGYPGVVLSPDGLRPKAVNNAWAIPTTAKVQGHSVTSTYQITDNLSVRNVFGRRTSYLFTSSALDGITTLRITPQAAPLFGFPASFIGQPFHIIGTAPESRSAQTSDEIQFNYDSDFLTGTAGATWFKSTDHVGETHLQNSPAFTTFIDGVIPATNIGESLNRATSIAAYAQLEFHFSPQIDVIVGGRVTHDKKSGNLIIGPNDANLREIPFTYKKTKPTYSVGVNYKPTNDILAYLKYSTGYVSGGSVAGIPFAPETVKSAEGGIKAEMLDRKLRMNLAVFWAQYKHFQTAQGANNFVTEITAITGDPTLASLIGTFVADQGGPVTATGFEFDMSAAPVDGMTLGGSLSYTKTKFKDVSPILLSANGGDYQSTFRPKMTGGVWGQFDTEPLGSGDAYLSFRTDAIWQSRINLMQNPLLPAYSTYAVNVREIKAYWLVNGRVALRELDLGGVNTTIAVWGKNLTDTREKAFALNIAQIIAGTSFIPARSFGVDVTVEF